MARPRPERLGLRRLLAVGAGLVLATVCAAGCGSCGEKSGSSGAVATTATAEGQPEPSTGRTRPFHLKWDGGRHRRHRGGEGGPAVEAEGGAPAE